MLNLFRTVVLVSLASFLYYYYGTKESDLERRAANNFISQCSLPNLVALTVFKAGPHLDAWLAALAIQNVKITFMLDRATLSNVALVQRIVNEGHNVGIDAFNEPLTTSNIVATLKELGNIVGPTIKKIPRFYTLNQPNAEELAGVALQSAFYAVNVNTEFLKTGNLITQVAGIQLSGTQTILGMVDSAESQIDTTAFATFLQTLVNSKNNLVSLADCTQKSSAYDLWWSTGQSSSASTSTDGNNAKVNQKSSSGMLKWFLW
eukprot:NODE_276_length_10970_cov_0.627909.p5 type:complete len:262 gc:universal NODE_276_length_10970_cov_0.627909:6793-7578(+)